MAETFDGQTTTITVDGSLVGGVDRYQFFQGSPRVVRHAPLARKETLYTPSTPDYGTVTLNLRRNHNDEGQQKLAQSQAEMKVVPFVLTLADGAQRTFEGFCESMPLIGGKQNGQSINTSQCRIRITGLVT